VPFRNLETDMIDLTRFTPEALSTEPYRWGFIAGLFSPADGEALVRSFPREHFKTVKGYDGEKGYQYEARSLIRMGAEVPSHRKHLSIAWQCLADSLLSPGYRAAMSRLTGLDLSGLPMEVNVSHYGPKAWLGPHVDLEDKVVTHVFYFNDAWDVADGGCLTILPSSDMSQSVKVIPPLIGNSVVVVRSANSWHAVSPVRETCQTSRRSMAVTFYRPGSLSTMWPEGDQTPLHNYSGETTLWGRWLQQKWQRIKR
jgi:SM-20-related protein